MVFIGRIRYILVLAILVIGLVGFIQYESEKDRIEEDPMVLNVNFNGTLEMVNGSYADITKMSVRNGLNGELIEIDNKDEITALINCISGFSYTENSSLEGHRGWLYSIKFYSNNYLISSFTIANDYHVNIDGVHYTPDESGIKNCVSSRPWAVLLKLE